ncbi:MAG: response regulator transcription factor [Burkholderiales bacterium]|nr:response regulator transcription factor [Burkholderiales bacterium]
MNAIRAPLRILIVDDELPALRRLRELLADIGERVGLVLIGEAAHGREALVIAAAHAPDVVLLDVRMPEIDGIEVARHLQKLPRPPVIVFTTAYDAYAIKAFEVHAVDYLLKPIRAARLEEALNRARAAAPLEDDDLRSMQTQARVTLCAQERGRIHLIPVADILYLKAELKYVTARTVEREFVLEESLTKLEQEFAERFVRIHRNCLVARAAIRGFARVQDEAEGHWVVMLKGIDDRLAVSRRQHHVVRELRG